MDPRFAQIYGLVNNNQLEKTAQEMLNEQISENTGVDMSSVAPEQLEQFAQQMLSESEAAQAAESKDFANMTPEQLVQTEEVQTGDVIGKTAAYAMYATLIPALDEYFNTKLAGFGDTVRKGYDAAKGGVSRAGSAVVSAGKRYGNLMAGGTGAEGMARPGNSYSAIRGKGVDDMRKIEARKSLGTRAGTGLAALGIGGGTYAATKEASALETMAYQKVLNVLAQNGIDINALQQAQSQEVQPQMQPQQMQQQVDPAMKMANDYRALVDQYTDQLAMQMLQNSGFQFQQEQGVDPTMMNQNAQTQGVPSQQFVG